MFQASLSGSSLKTFERLLKGPSTQKYDPALRSFALTLSFYSPRAYNFVRSTFNKSLPHLSTISKWYRSVDGSPGFTQEALLALKLKNDYALSQKELVYCNLVLDEMSIRRQKYLIDGEGNQIDWSFLVKLVDTQYAEGLHLGTKIKYRHMHWVRRKMKVKIATQTLSRCVSDALLYLSSDLKLPTFQNADATAVFIRKFNDLFDSLNSRNRLAKYMFKRPLSPATVTDFFILFDDVSVYIKNLKLASIPLIESPRKTGFLGFLICINSIKGLYKTYILENKLKYILTNKLSQDHLELFFGAIRGKGGFNNNPSVRHFESAYKRLLIHTEVTGPRTGNITVDDRLTILSCGSGREITTTDNGDDLLNTKEYLEFEQSVKDNLAVYQSSSFAWNLTVYTENVVQYISGFVVKTLKKCVTCAKCTKILESATVISSLQKRKQYGNLVKASDLVINVCTAAEKYFRFFHKTTNIFNKKITFGT
nr:unnamed protein product [Callosobruchus chinensis]